MDHSLNLDKRQRDMLAAMGVTCWWPEARAEALVSNHTTTNAVPVPAPAARRPRAVHDQTASINETKLVANNLLNKSDESVFCLKIASHVHPHPSSLTTLEWAELNQTIEHCTACGLCEGRKQAIPGTGSPHARWMIVGEAPDEQADKLGQAFAGQAGQLLDAMLTAMGLTRETDVYITNVIKCRPPHGRNPEPTEVAQCTPYLLRQMDLVQPDMVLALGRMAAQAVLAGGAPELDKLPLGKLRGQVHTAAGRPLVVTYHPTYLLRNPAEKAKVWNDLCLAMAHVGHNPLVPHTTT